MSLQTVDRAVLLLKELALANAEGMRLVDVQQALALSKPTAHRLITTLLQHRMLQREADGARYRLGPVLQQLGQAAMPQITPWHRSCLPALRRLAVLGHASALFARCGVETLCIDTCGGRRKTAAVMHPGLVRPIGIGAAGVSMLAAMTDEEVARVLREVEPRIARAVAAGARDLQGEISQARREGYAVVRGMSLKGMAGVAAALPGDRSHPLGSIGMMLPAASLDTALGRKAIDAVLRVRDQAEREALLA